ncbi:phosphoribosylglycinamide formyltransferase [Flavobacterium gilvum]|uniref:Phosphoribosylglycinamide formyltransferase n=1 Tax=Flavobacterium gilvum TaxID=1492737 RepID=A0AAC9N4N8_9FLAO|nr:phosphoribosylglycinamide formyltransferase [Flavobacterium gilvum]AOW08546.1 phosphoribosylglycinamide formyltransferase [Flavobacterium gilvum]KFC58822.1 phosphoribosylglycinamide formyltransferase [Flavobacterium gilvum]
MKRILIFASGSGTNAKNIIEYFGTNTTGTVVAVFSNNSKAGVLEKAQKLNVPTEIFSKEELNSGKLLQKVSKFQPDLIVLAGFLLKCPQDLIESYPNRIINIHPALLPKFGGKGMYGMHVHNAVVENKEKETGITIHYVNENYDEGAVIFQKSVVVLSTDTPEVVAEKIHELEQRYFPSVIENLLTSTSNL